MNAINWRRVAIGAAAAGVLMNVMDAVTNGLLMFNDFQANSRRLGLDPAAAIAPAAVFTWIALDFVFGWILVWMYAAMRPRYGPGVATALRSATAMYVPTTSIIAGFAIQGFLTPRLFAGMALAGALTLAAGALIGGWLYRE
jgi:hypothetical protein